MLVAQAETLFVRHVALDGLSVDALTPVDLTATMLSWYRQTRAWDAARLSHDGDGLLIQWGTYAFDGPDEFGSTSPASSRASALRVSCHAFRPRYFQPVLWQLSATIRFEPTTVTEALGRGSEWCFNPRDLENFRDFVDRTGLLQALSGYSDRAAPWNMDPSERLARPSPWGVPPVVTSCADRYLAMLRLSVARSALS